MRFSSIVSREAQPRTCQRRRRRSTAYHRQEEILGGSETRRASNAPSSSESRRRNDDRAVPLVLGAGRRTERQETVRTHRRAKCSAIQGGRHRRDHSVRKSKPDCSSTRDDTLFRPHHPCSIWLISVNTARRRFPLRIVSCTKSTANGCIHRLPCPPPSRTHR